MYKLKLENLQTLKDAAYKVCLNFFFIRLNFDNSLFKIVLENLNACSDDKFMY